MQEDSDSGPEERGEDIGLEEQGKDDADGSDQGPEGEDSSSDLEDYGEQDDHRRNQSHLKKTEVFMISAPACPPQDSL